jgi:hypothetical protein
VPEIIAIDDGGTGTLHGLECGIVLIKFTDGEGAVQQHEVYCMSHNKQTMIETFRAIYLRKPAPAQPD